MRAYVRGCVCACVHECVRIMTGVPKMGYLLNVTQVKYNLPIQVVNISFFRYSILVNNLFVIKHRHVKISAARKKFKNSPKCIQRICKPKRTNSTYLLYCVAFSKYRK